jgi:hypothetical protein
MSADEVLPADWVVQDDEMLSAISVMSAEGEMLDNEVRVVPADRMKPAEGLVQDDEVLSDIQLKGRC